jgi:hypothetical protein
MVRIFFGYGELGARGGGDLMLFFGHLIEWGKWEGGGAAGEGRYHCFVGGLIWEWVKTNINSIKLKIHILTATQQQPAKKDTPSYSRRRGPIRAISAASPIQNIDPNGHFVHRWFVLSLMFMHFNKVSLRDSYAWRNSWRTWKRFPPMLRTYPKTLFFNFVLCRLWISITICCHRVLGLPEMNRSMNGVTHGWFTNVGLFSAAL